MRAVGEGHLCCQRLKVLESNHVILQRPVTKHKLPIANDPFAKCVGVSLDGRVCHCVHETDSENP